MSIFYVINDCSMLLNLYKVIIVSKTHHIHIYIYMIIKYNNNYNLNINLHIYINFLTKLIWMY